ncbi:MAG: aminotransferase class I/II-fold pyridoxal phosphate-dependent enzyme [Chloroflexi bacterium]|nr:aminotransferase class I/II-fold pyridoxal phosphate-dependent enzyme [Chloroflexota bacterium]
MPIPLPRQDLRAFKAYGQRPIGDAIRLNANEWPEPTAAGAYLTQDELDRLLLNRYPGPAAEIRTILSKQYGVRPDQLMFGNGSNDTIMQLFLVFGGHGRTTLLFQPTYNLHGRFTAIAGGTLANEMIGLPYRLTRERALDVAARTRPHFVCFCTPNNPTGTVIEDDVILAVAKRYPETLMLVDEAYADIAGRTLLPAIAAHSNLVISKTFSKVHAAAGLRFGILVMHPELAESVRSIQISFNVSVVTYALATKIARDEAAVRERISLVRSERERVFRAMRKVDGIEPFPSEANFILFRVGRDTAAAQARFLEQGIALRDMAPWAGCEGCLRVSIGTPRENDRFLAALSSVFATATA